MGGGSVAGFGALRRKFRACSAFARPLRPRTSLVNNKPGVVHARAHSHTHTHSCISVVTSVLARLVIGINPWRLTVSRDTLATLLLRTR